MILKPLRMCVYVLLYFFKKTKSAFYKQREDILEDLVWGVRVRVKGSVVMAGLG